MRPCSCRPPPAIGPDEHLTVGEALQQAWLTATSLGLAVSIITQPLHLDQLRRGLRETLGLTHTPQVLLRVGYPSLVPPPRRTQL